MRIWSTHPISNIFPGHPATRDFTVASEDTVGKRNNTSGDGFELTHRKCQSLCSPPAGKGVPHRPAWEGPSLWWTSVGTVGLRVRLWPPSGFSQLVTKARKLNNNEKSSLYTQDSSGPSTAPRAKKASYFTWSFTVTPKWTSKCTSYLERRKQKTHLVLCLQLVSPGFPVQNHVYNLGALARVTIHSCSSLLCDTAVKAVTQSQALCILLFSDFNYFTLMVPNSVLLIHFGELTCNIHQ